MGLFQKAYETYEYNQHLVGECTKSITVPLSPISHIGQKAQIEIHLKEDGTFYSATSISKEDARTIIPATEASAGRTSAACAHPLCDQLAYVASYNEEKHTLYLNQLRQWAESEYTHPIVQAVLTYVLSDTILTDLQREGLIKLDEGGKPTKDKIEGMEYEKCLIRWCVLVGDKMYACWKNKELYDAFIGFYRSVTANEQSGLCMLSGEENRLAQSHPKGVVAISYGAKLISANDSSGFTYRGRFVDVQDALTISYEASQKAHNALQWVIANQGETNGGRTFVIWNPKGKKVPRAKSSGLLHRDSSKQSAPLSTMTDYYKDLKDTLQGYKNKLPDTEDVIIACFDAATEGRLSLTYYNELKASDFMSRVEAWYTDFVWDCGEFGFQSEPLWAIIGTISGVERNGRLEPTDKKVYRQQMQTLLHCIIDRTPIPAGFVAAAAQRASTPLAFSTSTRTVVLYTACSMIRKHLNDKANKEEWKLALDKENKNRSYLFGRLLAVAELAERSTYSEDEKREPNAIRLQSRFSRYPMATWRTIREQLNPYFQSMKKPSSRVYYQKMIDEITDELPLDEDSLNQRLEDVYLLGYSHQRTEMYKKKKKDATQNNESNEDKE